MKYDLIDQLLLPFLFKFIYFTILRQKIYTFKYQSQPVFILRRHSTGQVSVARRSDISE